MLYFYNKSKKADVLHGSEHIMNNLLQFLSKSKSMDSCGVYKTPSSVIEVKDYSEMLSKIKSGIKLMCIVDITKDNAVIVKR